MESLRENEPSKGNQMNKDLVYSAELSNDSGVDASPFLGEALESIVDDLMTTGKARGLHLRDFLEDQADTAELLAKIITTTSRDDEVLAVGDVKNWIEGRLKAELADSDCVHDLAAQLAAEKPEDNQ